MGKIKLLYDVVTTMKDKEYIHGNLKVEGSRNQVKIFGLDNEFEKNMSDGRLKARIALEMDKNGKKVKHESSTEFEGCGFHDAGRQGMMDRLFSHYGHGHRPGLGHTGAQNDMKRCGLKDKLSRLAFMLSILNSIKVKEQEDQSTVLSLDFADIPGDMKELFHEKLLLHKKMHHEYGRQLQGECLFQEFSGMDILNGGLNVLTNKNKEVEGITLTVEGKQKNDSGVPHQMNLQAEIRFAW